MGDKKNAERIWEGKLKGQRPLGRPRHIYKDNIKMDLKQWETYSLDSSSSNRDTWHAVVNTVMKFQIPQNSGNL